MCIHEDKPASNSFCSLSCVRVNCHCTNGFFQCDSEGCVSLSYICDGKFHCRDHSDEFMCPLELATDKRKERSKFLDPLCLYKSIQDFNDNPIMMICTYDECSRHFKCWNSYCIPLHFLCDGILQCPYGDDEDECHDLTCVGLFRCRESNICVHPDNILQWKT